MMGFRDFIPDVSNGISIPAIFANVWFLSDTDDFGMPFRFLASFRNIISFSRDVLSVFCLEIFAEGCFSSICVAFGLPLLFTFLLRLLEPIGGGVGGLRLSLVFRLRFLPMTPLPNPPLLVLDLLR